MTERQLQDAVIELAQLTGWLVAHFRPAKTDRGWRTPVQADGKGFPDLVLVRAPRVVFAELKGPAGRLIGEQRRWLDELGFCRVEAYVWTPADWLGGLVENVLRAGGARLPERSTA